jgi:hypothetical protein
MAQGDPARSGKALAKTPAAIAVVPGTRKADGYPLVPLTRKEADGLTDAKAGERIVWIGRQCTGMMRTFGAFVGAFRPEIESMRERYKQQGRRKPIPGCPTWEEVLRRHFHVSYSHMARLLAPPKERKPRGTAKAAGPAVVDVAARRVPTMESLIEDWKAVFPDHGVYYVERRRRLKEFFERSCSNSLRDLLVAAFAATSDWFLDDWRFWEEVREASGRTQPRCGEWSDNHLEVWDRLQVLWKAAFGRLRGVARLAAMGRFFEGLGEEWLVGINASLPRPGDGGEAAGDTEAASGAETEAGRGGGSPPPQEEEPQVGEWEGTKGWTPRYHGRTYEDRATSIAHLLARVDIMLERCRAEVGGNDPALQGRRWSSYRMAQLSWMGEADLKKMDEYFQFRSRAILDRGSVLLKKRGGK